eukprot:9828829-Lingulodinium_polyedra.AAC.1
MGYRPYQRCAKCGCHRRAFVPRRALPRGIEVKVPNGASGNLGCFGANTPVLITFDGGPRSMDGFDVAAGAAI